MTHPLCAPTHPNVSLLIKKFATSVSIAAENIATPCLLLTTSSTNRRYLLIVLDDDEASPQPVAVGDQRATVLTP
jgi:hypothetical protein